MIASCWIHTLGKYSYTLVNKADGASAAASYIALQSESRSHELSY